ncbi:MAG: nucleotide sugar dehydrogenase [Syntrophus sp. (in: bacteria)]|nr:nucleotide sugar dehydrogenase [Syntrophus sp. (in: bacteria)]
MAAIGVIGLGYVGLPLIIEFHKQGFSVTGFDIDPEKVRLLNEGKGYIKHIDVSPLFAASATQPRFHATTDFSGLTNMDCILICVPTPLNKYREPDLSYVMKTTETIAQYLKKGQLVILESTTYPGTTDEDMRAVLEKTGFKAGKDFHLAFSPEREDPNNGSFSLRTTPKVVGGYTEGCLAAAKALYDTVVDRTVPVSSPKVAEATKLLENIYRSVNIALVNELKVLFDKMGIDVWEVIEAAKTKPFGFQAFYPGPGLGGHCIPIDPFYLTWKAREYDFVTRFIELAGEINTNMPDYVVSKVAEALNEVGKPVKGTKILMLGLAYKANVDDDRESPSYRLMDKLEEMGAIVSYNDPYIPIVRMTREYAKFAGRKSVEITKGFDMLLIATAHDEYRAVDFLSFGIPVVDTRHIITAKHPLVYRA